MAKKEKKNKKESKNLKGNLKGNLNIPFLIIGVLALLFGFINNEKNISQNDLKSIDINLSSDIEFIKGIIGENSYRFWSKSYDAEFVLKRGSIPTEAYSKISQLKKDDLITILINKQKQFDLKDKLKKITVFSIENNNQILFNLNNYNLNRKMYNLRIKIIMVFGGIMCLFNGFSLLRHKQNYLIIGLFIVGVIIMRIFEFGIYIKN